MVGLLRRGLLGDGGGLLLEALIDSELCSWVRMCEGAESDKKGDSPSAKVNRSNRDTMPPRTANTHTTRGEAAAAAKRCVSQPDAHPANL